MTTGDDGGTRERLLRATVAVGARAGWGGVTTRAVAAEAGVLPGVVHYHAGSVAALRRAAAAHALADLAAAAATDLDATTDVRTGVTALLTQAAVPSAASAYLYEAFLAAPRDPELRAVLADALHGFRRDLAAWVERATAGHPPEERPDPAAVALVLGAVLDGLHVQRGIDPGTEPAAAAEPLVRMLEGGAS